MSTSFEQSAGTSCFPRSELERSIPARFEQQTRWHPERMAVQDSASALTYRDLNRLANRIAHAILAKTGKGPEPVALLVANGIPVIAAMLGVLKAGKFYVALDASQSVDRMAAILAEIHPALLIADNAEMRLLSSLPFQHVPILNLDGLDPGLSEENPCLEIPADTLAFVLFTSGSTGTPKGVMQDHRYVLHLAMVYTNSGGISASDRLALLCPPGFAGAVRDIYCSLLNGAALLAYDVQREGLTALPAWLRQNRITVFFSVATMFRNLCSLLSSEARFPAVRLIQLGSEPVYRGDVQLYQRYFPRDCRMIANLGGSEISPICQFPMDAETRIDGNTVPAGYAAEDIELLLLDAGGIPVEAGSPGEIVVRSRYLCHGYWNRPDLTAKAFLPDPEGGARRLFRTGEMGRLLPDGCLVHLGRCDFQVRIGDHCVTPAELEGFFTGTGLVREAAVTSWLDSAGRPNLAAWLVPVQPEAPPSVAELRALAAASLPGHMVPSIIVLVNSLPTTSSGKLDRRALPDPRRAQQQAGAA